MRKSAAYATNYGVACAVNLGGVRYGVATENDLFYQQIVIDVEPVIAQRIKLDERHSQSYD